MAGRPGLIWPAKPPACLVIAALAALLLGWSSAAWAATCPGASDPSCSVTAAYGNTSALGSDGQNILRQPQAVDLAGGSILVGDRWGWHLQRFDATHDWAEQWGEYGSGPGQVTSIGGIAHDSGGNVYVLDIDNNRVEKFGPTHEFLMSWGGRGTGGTGPADFNINFKGGIAVDGSSFVYVSDTYNHRVVKFDTSGNYLGQIGVTGGPGSDNSHFRYPQGVTIDPAHDVFVADDENDRIQKFDAGGGYVATIGSSSTLNHPYDVGVDATGYVYVADNLNHRIDKFSASGSFVTSWGGKGTAPGQLQTPRAIAVDSTGHIFVADTNNGRMQEFDADGSLVTTSGTNPWGLNGRDGGRLNGPQGIDFAQDRLVVADTLEYWVQELDATDGSFMAKFGGHGTGPGQFQLPSDVAVDGGGNSDVADMNNDRVEQFDPSNNYIRETGGFLRPGGVAVDGASNFYVADTGHDRVQKFSPSGNLLRTWTTFGAGDDFSRPGDVAVSPAGDLYVADTGHGRVVEFDSSGSFVRAWDVTGTSPGEPSGIDVDGAGNVYVADPANGHLRKYGASGQFLLEWGRRGHALGEFWTNAPADVTTSDADGIVYVSDTYNNRVQRFTFTASGSPPSGDSGGGSSTPTSTSATQSPPATDTTPTPTATEAGVPPPLAAPTTPTATSEDLAVARALLRRALARDLPRRLRIDRHGRVLVRVRPCRTVSAETRRAAITCRVAVGGSVRLLWRGAVVGVATLKAVAPGRSRLVAVRLSKSFRVRLARVGRLPVVVRVTLRPPAVAAITASRRVPVQA